MSKEWILQTLLDQGLPRVDAQVYVFLIIDGPNQRKTIAQRLSLNRSGIHHSLANLKSLGIIIEIPKRPTMFSALPFDKVLELLLQAKKEQTNYLLKNRDVLLTNWHELIKENEDV
jgi:sugar-specific transcriptional regulator TrmB